MPVRRALAVLAATTGLLLATAPAGASTTLVDVEPANGATLADTPEEAVLTFATDLDPARSTATVTAPGQGPRDVRAEVDGARLVVGLPASGDGDYVVGYTVAAADAPADDELVEGSVGFSVTPDGVAPQPGGQGPWAVAAVLAILGLVAAVLVTIRRWQGSR